MGWLGVLLNGSRCGGCGAHGWSPCPDCVAGLRLPPSLDVVGAKTAEALCSHEGTGRRLVHALKFADDRRIARWFGQSLAPTVGEAGPIDVVTWMPTTPGRRAARGYDQAERVAVALGRSLSLPVRAVLVRRSGVQTGFERSLRLAGPRFDSVRLVRGRRVVVVDDVVTTGGTAIAAVEALRSAGAVEVHARFCSGTAATIEGLVRPGRASA